MCLIKEERAQKLSEYPIITNKPAQQQEEQKGSSELEQISFSSSSSVTEGNCESCHFGPHQFCKCLLPLKAASP